MTDRNEWVQDALCAQVDPDLFFVELGSSASPARAICSKCPVAKMCLEEALANNEEYGVWGGLTPPQRKEMRRRAA